MTLQLLVVNGKARDVSNLVGHLSNIESTYDSRVLPDGGTSLGGEPRARLLRLANLKCTNLLVHYRTGRAIIEHVWHAGSQGTSARPGSPRDWRSATGLWSAGCGPGCPWKRPGRIC